MKKIASMICAVSLSAALLVGCGSSASSKGAVSSESEVASSKEAVESTPVSAEATSETATTNPVNVNVTAMKGPTAMGMVEFMSEADNGELTDNNYSFMLESRHRSRGYRNATRFYRRMSPTGKSISGYSRLVCVDACYCGHQSGIRKGFHCLYERLYRMAGEDLIYAGYCDTKLM